MLLRRFNQAGLARFRAYVGTLKADKSLPAPLELLEDDALTDLVQPETDCLMDKFAKRFAAANYLDQILLRAGLEDGFDNVDLGSWIALPFFYQLRPLRNGV